MSNFLASPISSIIKQAPITCPSTTTILQGLELLAKHRISSMPVLDAETNKYLGFFDILDVVTLIATMSQIPNLVTSLLGKDTKSITEDVWRQFIEAENQQLKIYTVADLLQISSERNSWKFVESTFSIEWVMDMLNRETGIRRIAIVNPEDKSLVGVASQSLILDAIAQEISKGAFDKQSLHTDLATLEKRCVSWKHPLTWVRGDELALTGFTKMVESHVLGIPILNENDQVVGSLSASDLKASEAFNIFTDLYLPLGMYLEKSRDSFPRDNDHRSTHPICVKRTDTLKDAILKISANHVHRVFLVDEDNKLLNVLALCDLISLFQLEF